MSESASISSGIAVRYATAIFEIAKENSELSQLESNLDDLAGALDSSVDFQDLIASPLLSRDVQGNAIDAIAAKMGLSATLKNTLSLMSAKRRLFVVPQMIALLRDMIATEKGEVTAEVTSATELSAAQSSKLADTLKAQIGSDVKINATVDESLIGGLIVKVGSKMIDTSIRSKLNSLQNAMKEVG